MASIPSIFFHFTFLPKFTFFCTCVFWVISADRLRGFFLAFRFYVPLTPEAKTDSYHDWKLGSDFCRTVIAVIWNNFFHQLLFGRVFRFWSNSTFSLVCFPCVLRFTVFALRVYVHFGRIFSGRVATATATVVVLVHFTCTRNHSHCLSGEIKKTEHAKRTGKMFVGIAHRTGWSGKEFGIVYFCIQSQITYSYGYYRVMGDMNTGDL